MRAILAALVALAISGVAHADDAALAAYVQGDFLVAAARAENGDRTLAARALVAAAITGEGGDIDALLLRAEDNARAGLAAGEPGARLQLALALGLKGRRASIADALRHGYAREGRALIDAALRATPRDAWAQALDGAWNLEIVRRGGEIGARYFGASAKAGVAAYERARALAPDDAAITYQYALALLELDGARYAQKAAVLLDQVRDCASDDAFETAIKQEARRVRAVLASQGPAAAAAVGAARFRRAD